MTYKEIEALIPDGLAVLRNTVAEKLRHKDYARTVERAELYHKLITGEGIETLLRAFVRRETDEMFEQRKNLTQAITPAVASSLMSAFYKVPRANNITSKIDFESTEQYDEKKARIDEAIKNYYGDASLDAYMEGRFVELSWLDPNTFIVTEFKPMETDDLGNPVEFPSPYPWEVSSDMAVNFKIENNTLKWLVVRCAPANVMQSVRHIIYLPQYAISFDPVKWEDYDFIPVGSHVDVVIGDEMLSVIRLKEKEVYAVRFFEHKCSFVPAKRVGYKRDLTTKGETFVSPLEPALPYFMKSIKTVSEFDITMALSAHPQKIVQSPPCTSMDCTKGYNAEGKKSDNCHGTGLEPISTSAQDAISVPLARKADERIDLDNLVKYVSPEVALLEFQNKYIRELKDEAKHAVYNSEIFSRTEIAATATEKDLSMESVYDTLFPFAINYAGVRTFQVSVIAEYLDIDDSIIVYKFPKDFRFRTRDELIAQQKTASESNAPGYVKKGLSRELAEALFVDSPDELKRIRVKEMFHPFSDKTSIEISQIISSNLTPEANKVLWANYDQIFDELEMEAEQERQYLYDLPLKEIRERVNTKLQQIMSLLPAATPPQMFGQDEVETDDAA